MNNTTMPTIRTVPAWVTAIVILILRTPLLHRTVSGNTMLLSVTGRKTGNTYTFPVSYRRDGEAIICFTNHPWWKNLRDGAPVELLVQRQKVSGEGKAVVQDPDTNAADLQKHFAAVPRDARYHGVRLEPTGHPNTDDLTQAATTTTKVEIRLDHPVG